MGQTHFLPDALGNTGRPSMITGLGIASFINTGLFMMIYALGWLGMIALQQMPLDELLTMVHEQADQWKGMMNQAQFDQVDEMIPILHAHGALLMALLLGRTIARFIGVLGMWRGRRIGFYTYAAAQIAGIFLPHAVLPWKFLGIGGPLLALGMTALYGTQLKRMG